MGYIVLGALVIAGIFFTPHIVNWVHTVHCPKCGKWFCREHHSFVVTDKTVGHHRTRTGGSAFKLFSISFLHRSYTRGDPFICEWGEARYICRACGRHISIHNVKKDR